jgi:hypothetical protein
MVCGSGCSIGTSGSGTNAATSVPWSGITSVPTAAFGTNGIGSPDNVSLQTSSGVFNIKSPGANTVLGFNGSNAFAGFTAGTNISLASGQITNTSTANTVSQSMTGTCLTVAVAAHTIGCSLFVDNGTQGSYTGVAGFAVSGGTGPSLYTPLRPANAATNPLPSPCNSSLVNTQAVVNDASTTPTFYGAYTGGGSQTAPVICSYNGSSYSWVYY